MKKIFILLNIFITQHLCPANFMNNDSNWPINSFASGWRQAKWSPDGRYLATCADSLGFKIYRWDGASLSIRYNIFHVNRPLSLIWHGTRSAVIWR